MHNRHCRLRTGRRRREVTVAADWPQSLTTSAAALDSVTSSIYPSGMQYDTLTGEPLAHWRSLIKAADGGRRHGLDLLH